MEIREATLAVAEYGVWVAAAQVLISLIQTGIVAWGIRAMIRANDKRAAASAAESKRADDRHTEVMQAHTEAMKVAAERHTEAMNVVAGAIQALKEQGERDDKRHVEAMQALKKAQGQATSAATSKTCMLSISWPPNLPPNPELPPAGAAVAGGSGGV